MRKFYRYLGAAIFSAGAFSMQGASPQVDFSRIVTWVGEGDSQAALVFTWNDNKGLDNLVVGLRFNTMDDMSVENAVAAIVNDDPRFYVPTNANVRSLCFDNGGDRVFDDPAYTCFDHQGLVSEGEWKYSSSKISDQQVITVKFNKFGETGLENNNLFYLPAAETTGLWLADGTSVHLADIAPELPVYFNVAGGQVSSALTCTISTEDKKKISSIGWWTFADAKKGDSRIKVTFPTTNIEDASTREGDITLKFQVSYKPAGETKAVKSEINEFNISVLSPEVPLERIEAIPSEFGLNQIYPLQYQLIPDNATYTGGLDFKISDSQFGYVNKTKEQISIYKVPGEFSVKITPKAYTAKAIDWNITAKLMNPVTEIILNDVPEEGYFVSAMPASENMYSLTASADVSVSVFPDNADIKDLKLCTSLDEDPEGPIVQGTTTISPVVFGSNPKIGTFNPTPEQKAEEERLKLEAFNTNYALLDAFKEPKSCMAWYESTDGSGIKSEQFKVTLTPRDRTPLSDSYQDGTFWLNEEWFGHTNGSINYITADKNIKYRVYEAQNSGMSFGCTSQYGMIYGDRLYVMSKQQADSGDRYRFGGGRLVIADAKTLKRITSFDEIGTTAGTTGTGPNGSTMAGDGRACVGVRPDKIYLGHHKGIRVLNIDLEKAESSDPEIAASAFTLGKEIKVSGDDQGLYDGQTGDMVTLGKYVFVVSQSNGLLVIDGDTDEIIKNLGTNLSDNPEKPEYSVQGVVISADGHVWYAETDNRDKSARKTSFVEIDPLTLTELNRHELPQGAGTVNTGWGAWRSANFFAAKKKNVIYWGNVGSGYQDDILGSGTGNIYRWEIGNPLPDKPFFSLGKRPGMNETTFQSPYATMRYDDRTDEIWMCTTHGASTNYMHEWIYAIDGTTGEENFYEKLKPYFWFPAIPIFPDKYAPEFIGLSGITLTDQSEQINLYDFVDDKDNVNGAIRFYVENEMSQNSANTPFDYILENGVLTLYPQNVGTGSLTLVAESNGKTTKHILPVNVKMQSGISEVGMISHINCSGNILNIIGYASKIITIMDINGRIVDQFLPLTDSETRVLNLTAGIYIVKADSEPGSVKIIIK